MSGTSSVFFEKCLIEILFFIPKISSVNETLSGLIVISDLFNIFMIFFGSHRSDNEDSGNKGNKDNTNGNKIFF